MLRDAEHLEAHRPAVTQRAVVRHDAGDLRSAAGQIDHSSFERADHSAIAGANRRDRARCDAPAHGGPPARLTGLLRVPEASLRSGGLEADSRNDALIGSAEARFAG